MGLHTEIAFVGAWSGNPGHRSAQHDAGIDTPPACTARDRGRFGFAREALALVGIRESLHANERKCEKVIGKSMNGNIDCRAIYISAKGCRRNPNTADGFVVRENEILPVRPARSAPVR